MKRLAIAYLIAISTILLGFYAIAELSSPNKHSKSIQLEFANNQSVTYKQAIEAYQYLDSKYRNAKLFTYGKTDSGKPLHLFVISKSKDFNPQSLRAKGYRVVLVNNGIHPGEPCGIDASILLAQEILERKDSLWSYLDSTVICFIPVYNIGGALNRSPFNRANQNGPQDQGFRGNARFLDLNRDFAPMFSLNAFSFAQIFHEWKPDLLIDTHATNGADYQYVMTIISTHHQTLEEPWSKLYMNSMEPFLYMEMQKRGYEMTPYVDPMQDTPESGIAEYVSSPRYTVGYAGAFNTLAFFTETHMFKPFADRVLSTKEFIAAAMKYVHHNGSQIALAKSQSVEITKRKEVFTLSWTLDSTKVTELNFKGFEASYLPSKVTNGKRLFYDRTKPFTKPIPFYRYFTPNITVKKPSYYIVPQAWREVIERLRANNVYMEQVKHDTLMLCGVYYITDYKTYPRPYNGAYLNYNVKVMATSDTIAVMQGDYIVKTNQEANEYIVQMLEPHAPDSFFAWNFFNSILQRKEYFSPYIFEEFAEEWLKKNPELKKEFEHKLATDKTFAASTYAQLSFVYQNSPYSEKSFMRYPVFRSRE